MNEINKGTVPFTRHDVTQAMAVSHAAASTAMTFTNATALPGVVFSVNWNALRVGSTPPVDPGKNAQIGDEWVWYHIQATANGQVLAQSNNVYGDANVSLVTVGSGYAFAIA